MRLPTLWMNKNFPAIDRSTRLRVHSILMVSILMVLANISTFLNNFLGDGPAETLAINVFFVLASICIPFLLHRGYLRTASNTLIFMILSELLLVLHFGTNHDLEHINVLYIALTFSLMTLLVFLICGYSIVQGLILSLMQYLTIFVVHMNIGLPHALNAAEKNLENRTIIDTLMFTVVGQIIILATFLALKRTFAALTRENKTSGELLARIRTNEAQFRSLFNQSRDGLVVTDTLFRILQSNDLAKSTCGPFEDAASFFEQFPENCRSELADLAKIALAGRSSRKYRLNNVSSSGKTGTLDIFVWGLRGENASVEALVWHIEDVSELLNEIEERRTLEAQLRQAQKMEAVGQLAGGVAHDLNNLLTPMLAYPELFLSEIDSSHPWHEGLSQILKSGETASALVRQLLAFGRRQVLELRTVDLNDIVRGFEGILQRAVTESIPLSLRCAHKPCMIKADSSHMEQILLNLVINAGEAMPSGGRIDIETERVTVDAVYSSSHPGLAEGNCIRLNIRDTGRGMDAATIERIFEPFFSTKPEEKSSGLGLATVYGIVRQHGGHIEVASEPGKGSTFSLYFPESDATAQQVDRVAGIGRARGKGETILAVEDNDTIRTLLRRILPPLGYQILIAENPKQALVLIAEHKGDIDLLLTDVIMPGMNGCQLAAALHKTKPGLPVLYMSGHPGEVIKTQGIPDGDLDLIQKPFSVQALAARIRTAIDRIQ